MRYRDKWPEYRHQWDTMAIRPERWAEFERMARYAIAHKDIYQEVEQTVQSKFPWWAVAVAHKRESDAQDAHGNPLFTSYLGNGQPLNRVTTIVPKGRGPFLGPKAFLHGCLDALHLDGIDKVVPPWPIEKVLFDEELLNGVGYHLRGLPSPYIFGGTSIQRPGKFIRDHVFDKTVMDTQLGCAGMIWMIAKLDPSVVITRET